MQTGTPDWEIERQRTSKMMREGERETEREGMREG